LGLFSSLAILLLQIAVIVALARATKWVFVRLGQPAVVGEMVAGLLLGPSGVGWIMPAFSAAVFAPASLPALNALSQVGLVLFMFLLGLRLSAEMVPVPRHAAMVTGAVSIVAPFALGAWLGAALHARLAPAGVGIVPFSFFVGTAMSMTALPVLARILLDRHLLGTAVGNLAITCAALDDVAGWLVLGCVTALARGHDLGGAGARIVLFAAYVAAMLLAVRPALGRFVRWRGPRCRGSAGNLAVVVLVMAGSAVATSLLGVHALFGAFFAGLMMPGDSGVERVFVERVEPLTMALLLPLFFAFTGLRTSVQLIEGAALWRDAALVVMVAVVGKCGGSALAARVTGMSWRDATAVGVLLNTRGLIELVVLGIGLDLGILSPVIFSMLVLMALVTTFMTSPLIAWLLPAHPARPASV
jgi:Kef-type K+ transport system membrane component KefB